jgi:hypothetical protein
MTTNPRRDLRIFEAYICGHTMTEIGVVYGLHKQTISQIVHGMLRLCHQLEQRNPEKYPTLDYPLLRKGRAGSKEDFIPYVCAIAEKLSRREKGGIPPQYIGEPPKYDFRTFLGLLTISNLLMFKGTAYKKNVKRGSTPVDVKKDRLAMLLTDMRNAQKALEQELKQ